MTKFAIVIATYQRKDGSTLELITRCLESISKQTHNTYKVFLIGDRYENQEEFKNLGKGLIDPKKIHRLNLPVAKERDKYKTPNLKRVLWSYGGCNASNTGIDLALKEGYEYICRLDHDDYWGPDHLKNFNECIEKHKPGFICSVSTHIGGRKLPHITKPGKFQQFYPKSGHLIKSSSCVNQKIIPLRTRNLYEIEGKLGLPGDADFWNRLSPYLQKNKLGSFIVNETTCFHDQEGHTKR